MPNQFDNEYNVLADYETTGPEILAQTGGEVDAFVAGIGTSGTLMGVSRYLKEHRPQVQIVGIELLLGHRIEGLKNMQEAIRPKIFDPSRLDQQITVLDHEATRAGPSLATVEGIFVACCSGAAVAGALRLRKS